MNINVMDANAISALLRGEAGKEVVAAQLADPNKQCLIHAVNLCEVYYDALRDGGASAGGEAVRKTVAAGVEIREDMDEAFWKLIGQLKVSPGKVSLADCFALALAIRVSGTLVTADHHEMDKIVPLGLCSFLFIR
jgi:PIN domain nuclease of toxin-antitoxin system